LHFSLRGRLGTEDIIDAFKNVMTEPYIAELPPELIQCELGCRVLECSYGKWLGCENRIRCMQEEIACAKMESGQGAAPNGGQRQNAH
jgi:hypothetical protein